MDAAVRVPARVDPWVVAIVSLALVVVTVILLPLFLDPQVAALAKAGIAVMWFGTVGLTLGMSLPVRYRFEGPGFTVRAGLLTLRFAYRDIVRADRVVSPLSGPAWSLVRVRLALDGGGWIEVAPRDREAFLADLAARAPHLRATARGLADPERVRVTPAAKPRGGRR
ncbi:MAG: PH domain-containing protein [Trueperaceae bacterium]